MRRRLTVALFTVALCAVLAPSALAFGQRWTLPQPAGARLVTDAEGAWVTWRSGDDIVAQRYLTAGDAVFAEPVVLVDDAGSLGEWVVDGALDRGLVVAWKDGGTVFARRISSTGAPRFPAAPLATDAAASATLGSAVEVLPAELAADGDGGAYVRLTAGEAAFLTHIGGGGTVAPADPGYRPPEGVPTAMARDSSGRLFAVLVTPAGRVRLQRYSQGLSPLWTTPASPYTLPSPAPAGAQTPLGLLASGSATLAWRDTSGVRVQRISAAGQQLLLSPPRVQLEGPVVVAGDGQGGCNLVSSTSSGVRIHHYTTAGVLAGPGPVTVDLGVAPLLGGATSDASGDLSVAVADAAGAGAGIVRCTFLGFSSVVPLTPATPLPAAIGRDDARGLWTLAGDGSGGRLHRLADEATTLTLRSWRPSVRYGQSVTLAGYLAGPVGGLSGERVVLQRNGVTQATLTTGMGGQSGFYRAAAAPSATSEWRVVAAAAPGGAAQSQTVVVGVVPKVTLRLTHARDGARFAEYFAGAVAPRHAGRTVRIQQRTTEGWRTVGSARLDGSSRYRFTWWVPRRTATYTVRVVLPAHTDHLQGTSPIATIKVTVKKG
jgi:hypothetical protein